MAMVWVVALIIGISMLVGVTGLMLRLRRVQFELSAVKSQLEKLNSDLNALCAGAAGVDRRIFQLENQSRKLDLRQESLENQKPERQPYGRRFRWFTRVLRPRTWYRNWD